MVLNRNSWLSACYKEAHVTKYQANEYKPTQNLIKIVLLVSILLLTNILHTHNLWLQYYI